MSAVIDVFVGRQPILDKNLDIFGYELLFRNGKAPNSAEILEPDSATAQVMMSALGDIGLKDLSDNKKVFINFTESLLLEKNLDFFSPKHVVIEVLENVKLSPSLLRSLRKLREDGYTIALDDYIFHPDLKPLESFADIIKVDILEVGPKELAKHVTRLKNQGIRLLAEKVESQQQFELCKKIGFDYFQGYFFAKPVIIQGQKLATNQITVLELMSNLYDPNVDMRKLSKIISRDLSLSEKLLKFLASNDESKVMVHSVHDAVLRFGLKRLQSWASMLALAGLDNKPTELFIMALTRARFCELIGEKIGGSTREIYFTMGLFSLLDAVMDTKLDELLAKLKLAPELVEALISDKPSLIRTPLDMVKALERGEVSFNIPKNCDATNITRIYLQAIKYAQNTFNAHT